MTYGLPKISIFCSSWPEENLSAIESLMTRTVGLFAQEGIIPSTLEEIIFTEDYPEQYQLIAKKFDLRTALTSESEYHSVAKMCDNRDRNNLKHILLVDVMILRSEDWIRVLRGTLLKTCAEALLPDELRVEPYYPDSPLQHMAKIYFGVLFSSLYAEMKLAPEDTKNQPAQLSARQLISPFKRNVKRIHMRYQATNNWNECVIRYYDELNRFLVRYTENLLYNLDMDGLGDFKDLLFDFGDGLLEQSLHIIRTEPYSFVFLEKAIKDISALCFFDINTSGSIRVMETPKKLFPNLIDTHARIVGFVDILGFKNMIRDFDANRDIALLTDLKDALDHAIAQMKTIFKNTSDELEFKLFSDCLCISLPYFDNEVDFTYQFGSLMLGIKVYQTHLLQKGYLLRGGISAGSYYSNDNMIFSGALVDAYEFESTGSTTKTAKSFKPPRVLVSPLILTKLENTRVHYSMHPFFADGLIKDSDGEVFINPVVSISASRKVYETVLDSFTDNSGDEISSALNSMITGLTKMFIPLMSDSTEKLTYDTMIAVIDLKILHHRDSPFLDKYT
jgi:hypothetical protein